MFVAVLIATVAMAGRYHAAGRQATPTPFPGVLDEHPAIQYATRPTRDRVSTLAAAVAAGTRTLQYDGRAGYLRAVLDALGVPDESQLLVFSRSGVQRAFTGPSAPRAIYFDEAVAVGFIPGAPALEIAAHDPEQGVIFYTLDQTPRERPALVRRLDCLTCHVSANSLEVPGMIHRSHLVDPGGRLLAGTGHPVDHRTPLTGRWGGWFVTGTYAKAPYDGTAHMGNVTIATHPSSGPVTTSNEVFIRWLDAPAAARGYASRESDIAALMVFDHQMRAINLITRLNWESRVAAEDVSSGPARETVARLVDELADYLLFVGEAEPPLDLVPHPAFAARFAAGGPADRDGRSLRQFERSRAGVSPKRLFRYPCSYMIQSEAFARLPRAAKDAVYARLSIVLSGEDASARYAHLSPADRRAIVEILRDTLHDLPGGFAR